MFCSWLKQTRAAGSAALPSAIPAGQREALHHGPGVRSSHQPAGGGWSEQITVLLTSAGNFHLPFHAFYWRCPTIKISRSVSAHLRALFSYKGKENRDRYQVVISHSSTFPLQMSNKRRKKKITYSHSSNKKQLGKSVTQPKSIMLMKKIYKPRIMSLKTQASFRLKYKLSWKRNPSIQTDNPMCDNINTVLNL